MRRRILFYNDGAEYGGHEAMLVEIVRVLGQADDAEIVVFHAASNAAFRDHLAAAVPRARLVPVPMASQRLDNVSPFLHPTRIVRLRRQFMAEAPDFIVVAQGRIELALYGLLAGRLTGRMVVSYLPMAQPLGLISRRWHSPLREFVSSMLYRLPHRYVTISASVAAAVGRRCRAPVDILPNFCDPARLSLPARSEARRRLGMADKDFVLSVIGRLQIGHKGQDVALRALAAVARQERDVVLVIAGDGPDRERLTALTAELGLNARVRFRPWTDDVAQLYAATDIVLMPSRFEGMPLVMLEAMHAGIPMIASAVDGLADVLPRQCLVPSDDPDALAAAILRFRRSPADETVAALRERARDEFSPEYFRRRTLELFARFGFTSERGAPDLAAVGASSPSCGKL